MSHLSQTRPPMALGALLALSGASALICEVVWMRRLALAIGSTGLALTLTLSLYMVGLGTGGWLAGRRRWSGAPRGYGLLELGAAGWAVGAPLVLAAGVELPRAGPAGAAALAAALLIPPALLHGATLPAAAAAVTDGRQTGALYATNTAGAVLGALLGSFLLLPTLGVRGAELSAAALSATAGLLALRLPRVEAATARAAAEITPAAAAWPPMLAAFIAGAAALALEVAWSRLGALLLGGSVYAMAVVLAVFLTGVAAGAAWGRRVGLAAALALLGLGAVAGCALWRWLPHGLGLAYAAGGEGAVLPAGAALMALAMGFAPVASGAVFTAALAAQDGRPAQAAGRVLAANTAGSAIGAAGAGLLALPLLGIQGLVMAVGAACVAVAVVLPGGLRARGRLGAPLALGALLAVAPPWDAPLYAVGLYHRLDQFADLSPRAVERFAHDGWRLLLSRDGVTATVAVGESTRSGVRWLSVNGKVDASSGADMPTQVLSGQLPVRIAAGNTPDAPLEVVVVGLASGVTASEALAAGASHVVAIEIEPAVVEAAELFDVVNKQVLRDPRATVVVADARAWLSRPGPRYAAIISEPSNPWLTGVSNLFTREYWTLARARLRDDGVFCQWVQLYALPPTALRSIVRTFLDVFPNAWLFETIPGADALLIAAPALPEGLPIAPLLGPEQLRALAGVAPLNTDDRPWVEFEAPWWLYRSTGAANRALLESLRPNPSP